MRVEQKNTEILYKKIQSGDVHSKKANSKAKDKIIKNLVLNYNQDKIVEFLDALGIHLSE